MHISCARATTENTPAEIPPIFLNSESEYKMIVYDHCQCASSKALEEEVHTA